ncbi:MAG: DoxX family protein [Cryomorphaceae bacterium]|nr:DoxX family protein [Flavobacteriales bacterium]
MKLFGTSVNQKLAGLWLFFLRVLVSVFMLTHGYPKFLKLLSGDTAFGDPLGIGSTLSLVLAVFAEFFCSILLMLGLGSRLATIPLIITMATAAFVVHAGDELGKQEFPILYLLIYVTILVFGPGKFAVDAKLKM